MRHRLVLILIQHVILLNLILKLFQQIQFLVTWFQNFCWYLVSGCLHLHLILHDLQIIVITFKISKLLANKHNGLLETIESIKNFWLLIHYHCKLGFKLSNLLSVLTLNLFIFTKVMFSLVSSKHCVAETCNDTITFELMIYFFRSFGLWGPWNNGRFIL